MDAWVGQVHEVLGRAHALFGGPAARAETWDGAAGLPGGGDLLSRTRRQMTSLAGALPAHYREFADDAVQALDAAAGTDAGLGGRVRDAGRADGSGWASSGAVLAGAQADIAALAPLSGTPAAQRALITTLHARLAQQQHVVNIYHARDARLAALLRALAYGRGGASRFGAMPMGARLLGASSAGGRSGNRGALRGVGNTAAGGVNSGPCAEAGRASSGLGAGAPLGALTPDSGPREVAAAIIDEAHRRGYSPNQTVAILADALQESNLNPRAQSPNKLWFSIFQQDASYPGRHNPNLAIAEFFNRLDRHGGPSSTDIWKSIFWLQQRPGEPSAAAAYAHGRQAYLSEIRHQTSRAVAMYRASVGN